MRPTSFASKTTPWRVQIPGRYFPDKKRKTKYFKDPKEAEKFCSNIRKFGLAAVEAVPTATINEHAPLILAAIKKTGGNPERVFEALELLYKTRLNVKGGILAEVLDSFAQSRRGKVSKRTSYDDNSRLNKLAEKFGNAQIIDITEADLHDFFDGLSGHTRSIHKKAKVFFGWARKKGFIAINPMAEIEPREPWNARKDVYQPVIFNRMLRIAAGLEGCRPDKEPTQDFIRLLPWFVISGFCGIRSCEAFRTKLTDDAIKWEDLKFHRNPPFIHIRREIAKGKKRKRNIENRIYVEATRAWLELVPRESEFIVLSTARTLSKLKRKFRDRTGIEFMENALRNSFASYALTSEGKEGVGQLALQMGNSEKICLGFYIETLDPGTGKIWFGLRPDQPANVIPMNSAAA